MLVAHYVVYLYLGYSYLNSVRISAFFRVSNYCAHCRVFQASVFHILRFFQVVLCMEGGHFGTFTTH